MSQWRPESPAESEVACREKSQLRGQSCTDERGYLNGADTPTPLTGGHGWHQS